MPVLVRPIRCAQCGVVLALLGGVGCFSSQPVVNELPPVEQNLRFVVRAYGQAATSLGRPPQNAQELMPFLKTYGDPETLLRSLNDGQPYVVVGGLNLAASSAGDSRIVAYEQAGKDGRRYVVDTSLRVRRITNVEFGNLKFPAEDRPPAS